MHVMRNAVDHGLEKAEQRKRSGKAEQGQITLVVSQEDDLVHFNVRDDGRGVGMDTVKGFLEQVGGGIKITLDEGDEATEFRPFSTNIWLML